MTRVERAVVRGRVEPTDTRRCLREKALGTHEQGPPTPRFCRRWGSRHPARSSPRSADRSSEPGLAPQHVQHDIARHQGLTWVRIA
jgi:hypothetical protein